MSDVALLFFPAPDPPAPEPPRHPPPLAPAVVERQQQLCRLILSNPKALRAVPELQRTDFTHDAYGAIFGAMRTVQQRGGPLSEPLVARELHDWLEDGLCDHQHLIVAEALDLLPCCSGSAIMDRATAGRLAASLQREIRADRVAYDDLVAPLLDIEVGDPATNVEVASDAELDGLLRDIAWEWPGYIPRGFLTMLAADQEKGKSTVAQALCDARLRGAQWPDGQPVERPDAEFKLLWIDTEGSLALFRQRLRDWEMPRGRFLFPADPLQELTLDNPRDWAWIEAVIHRFKPPLVVIDSLSGGHQSNENSNDKDGLKPLLKRLSALAQRHQIAVVIIHHLRKAAPGAALYPVTLDRLRGAGAITQFCRSVIALSVPDPAAPGQCRLDVIKSNLCPKPPSLGYELTAHGPVYGSCPEPPQPRRAVDDAVDFLDLALANGPRPADELLQEARAAGIGSTALRDAKKTLGIKPQREGGKAGRWFWLRE